MNEAIKKILYDNAVTLFIALCSVILFIGSYILSLRADINSTQFQVQALQQSVSSLNDLIPQVASIKQLSQDTNDKVNLLYSKEK